MSRRGLMISEKGTSPLTAVLSVRLVFSLRGLTFWRAKHTGDRMDQCRHQFCMYVGLCNEGNVIQKLLFFFAKNTICVSCSSSAHQGIVIELFGSRVLYILGPTSRSLSLLLLI
jgi:hypothetical protein